MGKIIFQLLSCLYLYDSGIQVPVRIRKHTLTYRAYTDFRRHRKVCAKPVYRRPTPQGSLRKAGIPSSDVLRINKRRMNICMANFRIIFHLLLKEIQRIAFSPIAIIGVCVCVHMPH